MILQFKAPQKWWHGTLRDQNAAVVRALQDISRSFLSGLSFAKYEARVPGDPFLDEGPLRLEYFHDARAFNRSWRAGYDISPLAIAPDAHHGKCFVEFLFNGAAYKRSGQFTVLRDDWLAAAFAVSHGIEEEAKALLGER